MKAAFVNCFSHLVKERDGENYSFLGKTKHSHECRNMHFVNSKKLRILLLYISPSMYQHQPGVQLKRYRSSIPQPGFWKSCISSLMLQPALLGPWSQLWSHSSEKGEFLVTTSLSIMDLGKRDGVLES